MFTLYMYIYIPMHTKYNWNYHTFSSLHVDECNNSEISYIYASEIYLISSNSDMENFFNCIAPVMQFTDDSAMTRSLAESLIERKSLDLVDVARRFVKSYYQEPNRGYGSAVVTVSIIFNLLIIVVRERK